MANGHAHPDTDSDAIAHAYLDAAADSHAFADLYTYTLCPADGDTDTHGHAHPGAHPHAAAHLDTDAAADIHLDADPIPPTDQYTYVDIRLDPDAAAYNRSHISAEVH